MATQLPNRPKAPKSTNSRHRQGVLNFVHLDFEIVPSEIPRWISDLGIRICLHPLADRISRSPSPAGALQITPFRAKQSVRQAKLVQFSRFNPARSKVSHPAGMNMYA